MNGIKIALVAPSGFFEPSKLEDATNVALMLGIELVRKSESRKGMPSFLNGKKSTRLLELCDAEQLKADAIWCVRGGCGALELWNDYQKEIYEKNTAPMIGYSDITVLHFMRFYRATRIGIHGPNLLDLLHDPPALIEALGLLINKNAQQIAYPALKGLNHFLANNLTAELIPMNLASLASIVGCFDSHFFQGKILAIEDIHEPHYKVFRALYHLKNAGILAGLKALVLGYFSDDRSGLIEETVLPLALELGIPLLDWPIFGHDKPNWPLLFGAKVTISRVDDHFFTLKYDEQHDHTPIINRY